MIFRSSFDIDTKPLNYVNITKHIEDLLLKSRVREGICNVFVQGTTTGLMINEMDHMLMEDFRRFYAKMVDENRIYSHEDNAHSHIRAAFLTTDKAVPISRGKLVLGEWQSIVLWEFDVKDRKRKIIVTVVGDE